ncbi:MAG: hypothetical protein B0A82_18540 [Alkalinema sp. CACIAM 70d]|nr:MAG: hypothetical protein B0A82_18540 [Alkalinema sp. CACIAM 70d]
MFDRRFFIQSPRKNLQKKVLNRIGLGQRIALIQVRKLFSMDSMIADQRLRWYLQYLVKDRRKAADQVIIQSLKKGRWKDQRKRMEKD